MTEQEQRIAIEEALGFKPCPDNYPHEMRLGMRIAPDWHKNGVGRLPAWISSTTSTPVMRWRRC